MMNYSNLKYHLITAAQVLIFMLNMLYLKINHLVIYCFSRSQVQISLIHRIVLIRFDHGFTVFLPKKTGTILTRRKGI